MPGAKWQGNISSQLRAGKTEQGLQIKCSWSKRVEKPTLFKPALFCLVGINSWTCYISISMTSFYGKRLEDTRKERTQICHSRCHQVQENEPVTVQQGGRSQATYQTHTKTFFLNLRKQNRKKILLTVAGTRHLRKKNENLQISYEGTYF